MARVFFWFFGFISFLDFLRHIKLVLAYTCIILVFIRTDSPALQTLKQYGAGGVGVGVGLSRIAFFCSN